MRRHVGNSLIRARRELRFVLVDRYRALLTSRFTVLTTVVAACADTALVLLAAVRNHSRRSAATGPDVVAGTVSGRELSLVLRGVPRDLTALVLRTDDGHVDLDTTVLPGESAVRVIATLPPQPGANGSLAARTPQGLVDIPGARRWLSAAPAAAVAPAVVPAVEMGVRTVRIAWPSTTTEAALLLVDGDGHESAHPAPVDDGVARAELDLRDLDAYDTGTWTAWARTGSSRSPLALPLHRYPALDRAPARHRVRLPSRGPRGRVAEVGWGRDNQLTVRIDDAAAP